jgi:hypothetical protein
MLRRSKWLIVMLAVIVLIPQTLLSQVPGDCDANGTVSASDLVFMVSYFYTNGPAPVNRQDCDCDNNPGFTQADMFYLTQFLYAGGVTLYPASGPKLTEVSRTMVYTRGRTTGLPAQRSIDVVIAVAPNELIHGFSIPFSYAAAPGEANVDVDSVSLANSIVPGLVTSSIDNTIKVVGIYMDPTLGNSITAGTEGILCTVYFSQVLNGYSNDMLKCNTTRMTPQLYPSNFLQASGARVMSPGYIDKPPGDVTCDHFVDIDDVVQILGYIFANGSLCYW